jgi:hypothetical protein
MKGRYAFFGRALVMEYGTESEYRGADYNALETVKADASVDDWGQVFSGCVYSRYVADWSDSCLQINDWPPLYIGLMVSGEAAPRPGKAIYGR